MTDTIEATEVETSETTETAAKAESNRITAPKTVEELNALTELKTTEAATSYANFMNKHLGHIDGWVPLTPEQAWTVIYVHRVWQSSEERLAEKEALKVAAAAELEAGREAREAAKAKREADKIAKAAEREEKKAAAEKLKAEKAELKAQKDAEKAAKKAAGEDSDADLDSVEAEGTGEIKTTRRRRKAPVEETPTEDASEATEASEVDGF